MARREMLPQSRPDEGRIRTQDDCPAQDPDEVLNIRPSGQQSGRAACLALEHLHEHRKEVDGHYEGGVLWWVTRVGRNRRAGRRIDHIDTEPIV